MTNLFDLNWLKENYSITNANYGRWMTPLYSISIFIRKRHDHESISFPFHKLHGNFWKKMKSEIENRFDWNDDELKTLEMLVLLLLIFKIKGIWIKLVTTKKGKPTWHGKRKVPFSLQKDFYKIRITTKRKRKMFWR